MLVFRQLRSIRYAAGLTPPVMATITGLEPDELRAIENCEIEPTFNQYVLIHNVLGTHLRKVHYNGAQGPFCALVGKHALEDCVDPLSLPRGYSLAGWAAGLDMPVSAALDLTLYLELYLSDPIELNTMLISSDIWGVLSSPARQPACAWCRADLAAGEPHADRCLPYLLWGMRGSDPAASLHMQAAFRPEKKGKIKRVSMPARGFRFVRLRSGLSQAELARATGQTQSSISGYESGARRLSPRKAAIFMNFFRCTEGDLFLPPPADELAKLREASA